MDRRLSRQAPARVRAWRAAAFLVVVVAVAALHGVLAQRIGAALAAADAAAAMPKRIEVAYVRMLAPEAPRVAMAPPAEVRKPMAPKRVVRSAARSASAPRQAAPERPVPERPVEPATVSADAALASEPVGAASPAVDAAPSDVASSASSAASLPATAAAALAIAESQAAAAASAPAASSAPAAATFVWPKATRIAYGLEGNYRGPVQGQAEVEWIGVGARYQVNVELTVGPSFAPLVTRRATSEGRVGARGLTPERYDEDTQALFGAPQRSSVVFEPDTVRLADGKRRERPPGMQDSASQFIQFTWLFASHPELLRVGNTFEMPLALPRLVDHWLYEVVGVDTIYTSFGALQAFHLKPRGDAHKAGSLAVEMWFAPELRFLPVRIRIERDAATFVDLLIARQPEIADS